MFDKRERKIKKVLRLLAKQRLATILQPGNVWVIDFAVPNNEDNDVALSSCYLRGWAEPLGNAVPSGHVHIDNMSTDFMDIFKQSAQLYRLTDSGWAVVNRAQLWTFATIFIGIISIMPILISTFIMHILK